MHRFASPSAPLCFELCGARPASYAMAAGWNQPLRVEPLLPLPALLVERSAHTCTHLPAAGHSLGGAVASLAAWELKQRWPGSTLTVYTYGQPRVRRREGEGRSGRGKGRVGGLARPGGRRASGIRFCRGKSAHTCMHRCLPRAERCVAAATCSTLTAWRRSACVLSPAQSPAQSLAQSLARPPKSLFCLLFCRPPGGQPIVCQGVQGGHPEPLERGVRPGGAGSFFKLLFSLFKLLLWPAGSSGSLAGTAMLP